MKKEIKPLTFQTSLTCLGLFCDPCTLMFLILTHNSTSEAPYILLSGYSWPILWVLCFLLQGTKLHFVLMWVFQHAYSKDSPKIFFAQVSSSLQQMKHTGTVDSYSITDYIIITRCSQILKKQHRPSVLFDVVVYGYRKAMIYIRASQFHPRKD